MLPLPHALPAMPHPTSLLPAVPGPRPSAALCTGHREIPMLARPARPPLPALYVCLCVLGGVMFLCRSMCFLLSGQLSFAIRLLQLSIGLAVALHSFSVSFSVAHVVRCSPSRLRLRCALCCSGLSTRPTHGTHSLHTPHKMHTHHALSTRPIYTAHHIHHTNTSHHTPLFLAHMQV
jgi:hypothetical protein